MASPQYSTDGEENVLLALDEQCSLTLHDGCQSDSVVYCITMCMCGPKDAQCDRFCVMRFVIWFRALSVSQALHAGGVFSAPSVGLKRRRWCWWRCMFVFRLPMKKMCRELLEKIEPGILQQQTNSIVLGKRLPQLLSARISFFDPCKMASPHSVIKSF